MNFRLVPKSVTLNNHNGVMAVTLRYLLNSVNLCSNRVYLCMGEFVHESIVICSACTMSS